MLTLMQEKLGNVRDFYSFRQIKTLFDSFNYNVIKIYMNNTKYCPLCG